jgi:hypothetical protein
MKYKNKFLIYLDFKIMMHLLRIKLNKIKRV